MTQRRKGFTLTELLIVVITLGILSSAMLLSSKQAMSSADAGAIINNLTKLKEATNLWYQYNYHRVAKDGQEYKIDGQSIRDGFIKDHSTEITSYIDNSITLKPADPSLAADNYCFQTTNKGSNWYVGYKFFKDDKEKDMDFMRKFEGRADLLGLISITNATSNNAKAEKFGAAKDKYVYILALKLED